MFPEGQGTRRAFVRDYAAAEKTNELLENALFAIEKLWEQRGYDPKKPDVIKAKLGYELEPRPLRGYRISPHGCNAPAVDIPPGSKVHWQANQQYHWHQRQC